MSPESVEGIVEIIVPTPEMWQEFKQIRLEALEHEPAAFGSSYADESSRTDEEWQERVLRVTRDPEKQIALLARREQEPIGLVGAYSDDTGTWKVISFYVNSGSRGQGVGSELLRNALDRIQEIDEDATVELTVNSERGDIVGFYQRHGFQIIDTVQGQKLGDGRLHDEYVMRLSKSKEKRS